MRPLPKKATLLLVLLALSQPVARAGKVAVEYWDKWNGIEGAAMQHVVDQFNASQDRIEVEYSSISQIDTKVMLAMAGRKPPDIAGLYNLDVTPYAENNALVPLDKLAAAAGIREEDYLPSIWGVCTYKGHLWALPSTPYDVALHWNKKLFRAAGLDPDRPPRTIAELEQYNEKLTQRNADGTYRVFGHLPMEPGWYCAFFGYWFGGQLWDGKDHLTATDDGNRRALDWVATYPKRFGVRDISAFLETSGNFASPLNPFIQGRVAMEMQGPFMWNFIKKYGTGDFDLGVAPFPTETGQGPPVTLVQSDVLTIPLGASHVHEAFEFIRYVERQDVMEQLCSAHCKFTPLTQVSDGFWKNHPNPFIRIFYDLAKSPGAVAMPKLTIWNEYQDEWNQAVAEVWAERQTPDEAVQRLQARMEPKLDRRLERWNVISGKMEALWDQEEVVP